MVSIGGEDTIISFSASIEDEILRIIVVIASTVLGVGGVSVDNVS